MNLFHTLSCMFSPYQIASDIDITTRQTLFNDDQLLFFCFFSPTTLTILYDIGTLAGKIEFSLFYTKQLQTQNNWTNKLKQHHSIQQCIGQTLSRHTHTHTYRWSGEKKSRCSITAKQFPCDRHRWNRCGITMVETNSFQWKYRSLRTLLEWYVCKWSASQVSVLDSIRNLILFRVIFQLCDLTVL